MLLISSLIIVVIINFLLFLIAYNIQSDKLTDFAYSLSFIVVSVYALFMSKYQPNLLVLAIFMVVVWALRLGVFLVIRISRTGKDSRFNNIRNDFTKFLKFWLGQGVVAWFLLLPVLFLAQRDGAISLLSIAGVAIWLIGLIIETISDFQKYSFYKISSNKGKWIDSGFWRYSRHPNYFGEILIWVGMYVVTFSALDNIQRAIGLMSPVTIFLLLRYVTGVPPLEKAADKRWGTNEHYREYKKRTNLLMPFRAKV